MPTSRVDNARSGANTNETVLTPANVTSNSFGHLFSFPVDYVVMAQPLYVSNVNIAGQGTHNVVYVATQGDSLYAIDADNGTQLWYASLLNGGTVATGTNLPCAYGGFKEEGVIGTPVIDTTANVIYLVAKTVLNGSVRHDLHAIDITTGAEKPGSPVQIIATSVSNKGTITHFNSLHQKNRPGLLLVNGVLYMGFGSNGCNDGNSGWVMSYNPTSLAQLNVFNTSPDYGLVSIWQSGVGITADEAGNIFVETAETGSSGYDIPQGGQTYCNTVLELTPQLAVDSYFTPWSVAYLEAHDLDMSSTGVVALPDQPGLYVHEAVASGKQGIVYLLNRDLMGMFSPNDTGAIQELTLVPTATTDVMFGAPAYWNSTLYFAPDNAPIVAVPLVNGLMGTPLNTSGKFAGSHSPSISANGTTNGVMWAISGTELAAFDAVSMKLLYTTNQATGGRDKLPAVGHFVTQTVVNGKVYVATNTSLEAYALFHAVSVAAGNNQSGTVKTPLTTPIQIHVANPYNGLPDVGVSVAVSDGNKGGLFSPASPLTTDANGNASVTYTLPQTAGAYTLTFSGNGFANATTTATATPGAAIKIVNYSGAKQSGAAGSTLAKPIIVQAQDIYKNGVSGVTVNFAATKGAVPNPASTVTNASGLGSTNLQLPTTLASITVTVSSAGFKNVTDAETSVAGAAASTTVQSGNSQSGTAGTQLPQSLVVFVADQYGNAVTGAPVTFSDGGAGGSFSNNNPFTTNNVGTAIQFYTLPAHTGAVTIQATTPGVANAAVFTETAQ